MQYREGGTTSSEFGPSDTVFGISASANPKNQKIASAIFTSFSPDIQEMTKCVFGGAFNIYPGCIGEYEGISYRKGISFHYKNRIIGVSICFTSFIPKFGEPPLKCIEIYYIKESAIQSYSTHIDIETLKPSFNRLFFTDLESVIFAVNKILQEVFYQPMVDKIVAQRTSLLVYREALMEARAKNIKPIAKNSSCVLGLKSKKHWSQHIASFLADSSFLQDSSFKKF